MQESGAAEPSQPANEKPKRRRRCDGGSDYYDMKCVGYNAYRIIRPNRPPSRAVVAPGLHLVSRMHGNLTTKYTKKQVFTSDFVLTQTQVPNGEVFSRLFCSPCTELQFYATAER